MCTNLWVNGSKFNLAPSAGATIFEALETWLIVNTLTKYLVHNHNLCQSQVESFKIQAQIFVVAQCPITKVKVKASWPNYACFTEVCKHNNWHPRYNTKKRCYIGHGYGFKIDIYGFYLFVNIYLI